MSWIPSSSATAAATSAGAEREPPAFAFVAAERILDARLGEPAPTPFKIKGYPEDLRRLLALEFPPCGATRNPASLSIKLRAC